ncbi:MAG: hypothetical protein SCARUB_00259 [Candidatus Scalindua rubra]|uniref:Uncharacterized protein n=1 Tax=Candidatus Scalindua rubra TaxID=1872076 RepID=A0A1E3XHY0_9BACT|nr:MAG: hypothetical protein SCARUB_00259 [Candidatus Scalindua rubra]
MFPFPHSDFLAKDQCLPRKEVRLYWGLPRVPCGISIFHQGEMRFTPLNQLFNWGAYLTGASL